MAEISACGSFSGQVRGIWVTICSAGGIGVGVTLGIVVDVIVGEGTGNGVTVLVGVNGGVGVTSRIVGMRQAIEASHNNGSINRMMSWECFKILSRSRFS